MYETSLMFNAGLELPHSVIYTISAPQHKYGKDVISNFSIQQQPALLFIYSVSWFEECADANLANTVL